MYKVYCRVEKKEGGKWEGERKGKEEGERREWARKKESQFVLWGPNSITLKLDKGMKSQKQQPSNIKSQINKYHLNLL